MLKSNKTPSITLQSIMFRHIFCQTDNLTATTTEGFFLLRYELISQKNIVDLSDAIMIKFLTAALPHSFYYCKLHAAGELVLF